MKKVWIFILLNIAIVVSANNESIDEVETKPFEIPCYELPYDIDTLRYILGFKESTNNYRAMHPVTKCMGKYQFTRSTLDVLRIKVTREEFLSDSCLQEEAFDKLIAIQYKFFVRFGILNKIGTKTVDGIEITTEGLIMAAHLCGQVSVYDYIINKNTTNRVIRWGKKSVRVYKDDYNGTRIQSYLRFNKTIPKKKHKSDDCI